MHQACDAHQDIIPVPCLRVCDQFVQGVHTSTPPTHRFFGQVTAALHVDKGADRFKHVVQLARVVIPQRESEGVDEGFAPLCAAEAGFHEHGADKTNQILSRMIHGRRHRQEGIHVYQIPFYKT